VVFLGQIGGPYASYRRPDPRIAAAIGAALGKARSVPNVDAGAGSYEPTDREVTAVEPSAPMRAQRPVQLATASDAVAENLPFPGRSFDAAMTTFSIHQWSHLRTGPREMRRVTRGPSVILTSDPGLLDRFWLADYAPEVISTETRRYPSMSTIAEALGTVHVTPVPIPFDCLDGFNEAYYGRPEMLLDPLARTACSALSFVDEGIASTSVERLAADLDDGTWDRAHAHLRTQPLFDGSLVLVVSPAEAG
jgi:hypothetical protein